MRRGQRMSKGFAGRSVTHTLLRVGEDKQSSGPAHSSQLMLDAFFSPLYIYLYHESTLLVRVWYSVEIEKVHETGTQVQS
jgi:hypothetical protein